MTSRHYTASRVVAAVVYTVAVAGIAVSVARLAFPGAVVLAWTLVLLGSIVAYRASPGLWGDGDDEQPVPRRSGPVVPVPPPPLPPDAF